MNDFEIISANEAYKMTTDSIDKDNSVLKPIMEKIKKAINMKDYHCYIDGSTSEIILNKLVKLGYKVQLILEIRENQIFIKSRGNENKKLLEETFYSWWIYSKGLGYSLWQSI